MEAILTAEPHEIREQDTEKANAVQEESRTIPSEFENDGHVG